MIQTYLTLWFTAAFLIVVSGSALLVVILCVLGVIKIKDLG